MKRYTTHLILLSVILAILGGIYLPQIFEPIKFLGEIFINLLKLFALPLICSALITALGNMGKSVGQLKILARNTIIYMLVSEIIAVSIALILFNLFQPGIGVNPNLILHGVKYEATNQSSLNISNFLLSVFPHNIFSSLAKFELLPVVIFSIMFGIGCAILGESAKPITQFFAATRDVSNACLHGVMKLAPIGIFSLVGLGIAQSSQSGNLSGDFKALLSFVLILFLGLIIHALWQFMLVIILTKQNPIKVFKSSIPVFVTAFATSSSVATLPTAMETADNLKSNPNTTRFMLPLCASINIGGMMMYEVAAALFFSQVLGVNLSLSSQILVAIACILGGMAEGGIPETSLVSLVVVFKIVNVPLSAISILLPLDRIIDRFRTMVNIFGNMCGAIVVSNSLKNNSKNM
ncbi:MAG: dicarboxylate/amino acid:cation symporter [Neisseriaceae bacterium]